MEATATKARIASIVPFFIVKDIMPSIDFYRDQLGFRLEYIGPPDDPYFAMVSRDSVSIMLKAITPEVGPVPNDTRHPWARWDAYVYTPDPDALFEEFTGRGVIFKETLGINSDNLRGFEVRDADGYVLYFGRLENDVVAADK